MEGNNPQGKTMQFTIMMPLTPNTAAMNGGALSKYSPTARPLDHTM